MLKPGPTLLLVLLASCGGQQAATPPAVDELEGAQPPNSPAGQRLPLARTEAAVPGLDGDAGDCSERARVHPMCIQAMTQRCRGQALGCESGCETQFGAMPGNSEKEPGLRGDIESNQCRGRCNNAYAGCLRSLVSRCPETCSP